MLYYILYYCNAPDGTSNTLSTLEDMFSLLSLRTAPADTSSAFNPITANTCGDTNAENENGDSTYLRGQEYLGDVCERAQVVQHKVANRNWNACGLLITSRVITLHGDALTAAHRTTPVV